MAAGKRRAPASANRAAATAWTLAGALMLALALVWLGLLALRGMPASPNGPQTVALPQAAVDAGAGAIGTALEPIEDVAFGLRLQALAVRRTVQMLQWREVAGSALAIGDEVARDEGEYQLIWTTRPIDSSGFAEREIRTNPPLPPWRSQVFGEAGGPGAARGWQVVSPDRLTLPDNLTAVFRAQGDWLVTAAQGIGDEAGDLRVRFEVLPLPSEPPAAQQVGAAVDPDRPVAAEDPVTLALRWIEWAAALVLAVLGLGLVIQGLRWSRQRGR